MSRLNDPENFRGRVNYAAKVIAYGRRPTRAFDNCFENHDGDDVATVILRRSRKNAASLPICSAISVCPPSKPPPIGSPRFPRASYRKLPGKRAHAAGPSSTPGSNSARRTSAPPQTRLPLMRGARHDPRCCLEIHTMLAGVDRW